MNHQPFSDWLFEVPQDLTLSQSEQLQAHLETCDHCRLQSAAFRSLETSLRSAGMVAPATGFSERWQMRLFTSRQQAYQKQVILILAASATGLLALSIGMLFALWPWLREPSMLYWTWMYELFTIFSYADSIQDFVAPLLPLTWSSLPWVVWLFGLGLLSEVAVLWVISYRFLIYPRRVTG